MRRGARGKIKEGKEDFQFLSRLCLCLATSLFNAKSQVSSNSIFKHFSYKEVNMLGLKMIRPWSLLGRYSSASDGRVWQQCKDVNFLLNLLDR